MRRLTPTHRRMLWVLRDGMPHTRKELHACLNDGQTPLSNINMHISNLRKILRPKGEDIVCELYSGSSIRYRHVILLPPSDE